jgi:hypothetical protein
MSKVNKDFLNFVKSKKNRNKREIESEEDESNELSENGDLVKARKGSSEVYIYNVWIILLILGNRKE